MALKNYYEGLIDAAKDKSEFERLSKVDQDIVGILNLAKKDKNKTLPIYFTKEDQAAALLIDPNSTIVAGEIDYNKVNNAAMSRVASSAIYAGRGDIQRDIVKTVTEDDPFNLMLVKKDFETKYGIGGKNPEGQTFDEFINSMKLAQIKELVRIADEAEKAK